MTSIHATELMNGSIQFVMVESGEVFLSSPGTVKEQTALWNAFYEASEQILDEPGFWSVFRKEHDIREAYQINNHWEPIREFEKE